MEDDDGQETNTSFLHEAKGVIRMPMSQLSVPRNAPRCLMVRVMRLPEIVAMRKCQTLVSHTHTHTLIRSTPRLDCLASLRTHYETPIRI